jgi:hypothetical protein
MSTKDVGQAILELLVDLKVKCFTVKNFAVDRAMVERVAKGLVAIDVAVAQNINMQKYREYLAGRLAGRFRVVAIDWHPLLDPTAERPTAWVEGGDAESDVELMIKMLRANVAHVKKLSVRAHLDVDVSDPPNILFSCANAVGFLEALSKCSALESLSVVQRDYKWTYAERHSVQVKMLEIVQKMKTLKHLSWNGNMTENRFSLIDHEEGLIRCTICDYMPRNLVSLCLCDGNEDRVNSWVEYEVVYGMVSAFGRLMSKERHIKILKMPSSFWNMPRLTFDYFVKKINESDIEEIGFGDYFELYEGMDSTSPRRDWFTPRVEHLVSSLTKSIVVNLGPYDHRREREDRIVWAKSLFAKYSCMDTGFFKCERVEEERKTTFIFSKRYVNRVRGDGREFEVKVVM